MATLTVGAGKQFGTIRAAVGAARSGDTVAIDAGTYTNDFPTIGNKVLTLQGVGGLAHITGTTNPSNGKGALVPTAGLTVENMEFSSLGEGSRGNIAGIRHEGGPLVIRNSYFHDNQNGLLSTPQPGNPAATVRIEDSEFARNGDGTGQTHNIYVNRVDRFDVDNLYSHDARTGHNLKSRAAETHITGSRFQSEANDAGAESYSIDIPNGGVFTLDGSVVQQGTQASNPGMIAYGAEGSLWANSSATLTNNTAINDLASSSTSFFANWTGTPTTISNTKVFGITDAQMVTRNKGTTAVTGTERLAARPADDESSPIGGSEPPPPPPVEPPPPTSGTEIGTGPDTIVLKISQDAFQGSAQYTVAVDGVQQGGTFTASSLHGSGQSDTLTIRGDWAPGRHDLGVTFLNDAWDGGSGDRNLYVDAASYDGAALSGPPVTLYSAGEARFAFDEPWA